MELSCATSAAKRFPYVILSLSLAHTHTRTPSHSFPSPHSQTVRNLLQGGSNSLYCLPIQHLLRDSMLGDTGCRGGWVNTVPCLNLTSTKAPANDQPLKQIHCWSHPPNSWESRNRQWRLSKQTQQPALL